MIISWPLVGQSDYDSSSTKSYQLKLTLHANGAQYIDMVLNENQIQNQVLNIRSFPAW